MAEMNKEWFSGWTRGADYQETETGKGVKRILVVLEAGDAWPSGWVRGLLYRDLFAQRGYQVKYISRLWTWPLRLQGAPNRLLARLLSAGMDYLLGGVARLSAVVRGAWIMLIASRYDVVYMSKVSSCGFVKRLRRRTRARLVYDLNDAVWLPSWKWYSRSIGEILASVDAVTCDNEHGAEFARKYNPQAFVVPDPSQVELFDQFRSRTPKRHSDLVLGWIGSPSTVHNLYAIWEPLERLFAGHENLHLRVVGVGHNRMLLPRFEKVRWSALPYYSRREMVAEVLAMDIGLYPLFKVEDSLARGILKATIYMSGGVAVVCSDVGQCRELVADGLNGMIAGSSDEWLQKLELFVTDSDLRRRVAQQGLETARNEYNLERCFDKLLQALMPETKDELLSVAAGQGERQ